MALAGSAALLGGCVSSPTYGTGKTANAQLLEDVSGALSPLPKRKAPVDYKPRPEIVRPDAEGAEQVASLPEPQTDIATSDNPAWPESPEQRRARIRAEATASSGSPDFEPEVELDKTFRGITSMAADGRGGVAHPTNDTTKSNAQSAEFKRRKRESGQGSNTERKYLSEPPLEYRAPVETAAADELGEDELKKERRRKAESRKKGGKSSWKDKIPWL
ncbi:MAG: hypothetical protein IPL47_01765 [Phyllobacteriaceae bacterium]|nr:hypothetical protein [Phyllobacteriaceae bacterium]